MKCPNCGSELTFKIGYSMFDDAFFCESCDKEFDVPRNKKTDPKEWVDIK